MSTAASTAATHASPGSRVGTEYVSERASLLGLSDRPSTRATVLAWAPCDLTSKDTDHGLTAGDEVTAATR